MSLGPLYVLLGELSIQVLCLYFNWFLSSWSGVMRVLYISWRSNPRPRYHLQIYFPIHFIPFSFCWCILQLCRHFLFWWSPICLFFPLCPLFQAIHWSKYCCMEYLRFSCLFSPLGLLQCHDLYLSFIHLEFIFLYCVSWWLSFFFFFSFFPFFFFACSCPDLPTSFAEEAILTPFYVSAPLLNINWP